MHKFDEVAGVGTHPDDVCGPGDAADDGGGHVNDTGLIVRLLLGCASLGMQWQRIDKACFAQVLSNNVYR